MPSEKEHLELLVKILNSNKLKTLEEFIVKINQRIDSTAQKVGGRAHRCDFSHDPRVQIIKILGDDPAKWFKSGEKINLTKLITKIHNIHDIANSVEGQTVNGHKLTQELIDKAKATIEKMSKTEKLTDLTDFDFLNTNGPNMSNPAASNTIWGNLKAAFKPSNLHKAGKVGAKGGAIFSVATSSIKNIYRLCRKRTTIAEAGIDVGKDTISGTAGGYVRSMAGYGATVLIVTCASNPAGWVIITSSIAASLVAGGITTVLTKKGLNKTEEYIRVKV